MRAWILIALCVAPTLARAASPEETEAKAEKRDPKEFTFIKEEGFPLNLDPEIVAASEAPLEDGDLVLGIARGGMARAYPVNYMNGPTNEVVNDRLAGAAIAATW